MNKSMVDNLILHANHGCVEISVTLLSTHFQRDLAHLRREVSKVRKSMVDVVTTHGFCNASAYNINNLFIND